jgi:hypothetical protein
MQEKAKLTGLIVSAAALILYLALESFQVLSSHLVFPLKARSFLVAARGEARLPREDKAL